MSGYSHSDLNKIALHLNRRPRKTLDFCTPAANLRQVLRRPVGSTSEAEIITSTRNERILFLCRLSRMVIGVIKKRVSPLDSRLSGNGVASTMLIDVNTDKLTIKNVGADELLEFTVFCDGNAGLSDA